MAKGKRKTTGVRATRNHDLVSGIPRHGASWSASKSRRFLHSKKGSKGKQTAPKIQKQALVPLTKSRWYAADDTRTPLKSNKSHSQAKLRASITPGTVLIVLAGRFRGKRVIFLKQLESGLLLVTGPYKVNGVPLRRLNQRYVIATSTKVDIKGVDSSSINDAFFAKAAETKPKTQEFFENKQQKNEISGARKEAQKKIDSSLLPVVTKTPNLKAYLGAKFTLTKTIRPHTVKF